MPHKLKSSTVSRLDDEITDWMTRGRGQKHTQELYGGKSEIRDGQQHGGLMTQWV